MDSFSSVISADSDAVLLLKQVIVLSLVNSAYNGTMRIFTKKFFNSQSYFQQYFVE